MHAGDLGDGAGQVEVTDGFVIAESDALATAVLLEDQVYALGHTSRLVLPVVPGVKVPAAAPPCASLRSQPCRTYPG